MSDPKDIGNFEKEKNFFWVIFFWKRFWKILSIVVKYIQLCLNLFSSISQLFAFFWMGNVRKKKNLFKKTQISSALWFLFGWFEILFFLSIFFSEWKWKHCKHDKKLFSLKNSFVSINNVCKRER